MTTAVACNNCPGFSSRSGSKAIGEDFQRLQREFRKTIAHLRETITTGANQRAMIAALEHAYQNASINNWDGYGANPVKEVAKAEAERFLELMPSDLAMPEVSVDPDGDISFEWLKSNRYMYSVSLSGNNKIVFAGICGGNDIHGTEFFGDTIPSIIIDAIRRLSL